MSKRAEDFIEEWIEENIRSEPYVNDDEGPDDRPAMFAEQCLAAAKAKGIRQSEITDAIGDLKRRMAAAINASAQSEVDRLVAKDRS